MEVNIPGEVRNKVLDDVDKSKVVDDAVFDKVYTEVQVNICDTCTRFLQSPMYSQAIERLKGNK
jgi:hypothetical protein